MNRTRVIVLVVVMGAVLAAAGFAIGAATSGDDRSGDDSNASADGNEPREPVPATTPPVSVVASPPVEQVPFGDAERGTRTGSPLDDLPGGVRVLTDFGQRPDFSPDGTQVVFLDASPLGQVWIADVETGETNEITAGFENRGFSRVAYLSNGDLLLCGPTSGPAPTEQQPEAGRFTGVMSVLRAPFDEEPESLGVPCWEGIATAGNSMRIAWNRSDIDYTDPNLATRVINGITEIWTGEIADVDGRAAVVDARKVLDRDSFGSLAVFEVQDFRPPDENELILTAYAYQAGEVLGLDLGTGALRNYSNSSAYEEAEAVAHDGSAVYVERDIAYDALTPGPLDIWRLGLDEPTWERVTNFNRYAPFYASNPVVSRDGDLLAFQLSVNGATEGQGEGILLMDLTQ
ncbi:MAG TPA: hypothetical protein VJM33_01970 [Microthrixaceae bacterium]|nr:hypothetical protein [Microthrixaceae bacterium]